MGWPPLIIFIALSWYWRTNTPEVGVAVGCLAVAAAIFGARLEKKSGVEKFAWIMVIVALFRVELGAISKEKFEAQQEQQQSKSEQDLHFEGVLQAQQNGSTAIIEQQQSDAGKTIQKLINDQQEQRDQFTTVLQKQQTLFEHEDEVAARLGGTLIADNQPTPFDSCSSVRRTDDSTIIIANEESQATFLTDSFPRPIFARINPSSAGGKWMMEHGGVYVGSFPNSTIPVLTLDRDSTGGLVLILDLRSKDGRVIARLDRNGYAINRNNYFELNRDKSSFSLIDELGNEVLYVHYLNPKAILIREPDANVERILHSCFRDIDPIVIVPK